MKQPRIKVIHNPQRLSSGAIRLGPSHYGVAHEMQDDEQSTIWHLLGLMDGTRTPAEIVAQMGQIAPDIDRQSLLEAIETFIAHGFVEEAVHQVPSDLSLAELERYSRSQSYFSWVDTQPRSSPYELQQRLKRARVTILGLGGSGSAVAMSLAAAGVGHLHCLDFDRVESSNLNRQLIYCEADIGQSKVQATISRLRQLNSHITISGQHLQVQSSEDLLPLMAACDLFILCADKPHTQIQRWSNQAAVQTQTPWMMSFYNGPSLMVGTFIPFQTPCFACFQHDQKQQRLKQDGPEPQALYSQPSGLHAVIAPVVNITGHLGALEAIYFLTGLQPQTVGRIFRQNMMIYDHSFYITPTFWPQCPVCGPDSPYQPEPTPEHQAY